MPVRVRLNFCLAVALLLPAAGSSLVAQQVAFTIDDMPAHAEPPKGVSQDDIARAFLNTMRTEHLPKIFGFVNGTRVDDEPEDMQVLTDWNAAHQPLGNHTWSHPDLNDMTVDAFMADVDKDTEFLRKINPHDERWFRYPFLHEGNTLEKRRAVRAALAQRGYKVAQVSLDFEDYLWNEPYARCADQHNDAAIQYLHDSYLATADHYIDVDRKLSRQAFHRDIRYVLLLHMGSFDANMFPELVALFRKRGFSFITLQKAMKDKVYRIDPDHADPNGGTFQEMVLESRGEQVAPDVKPYDALNRLCRKPGEPIPPLNGDTGATEDTEPPAAPPDSHAAPFTPEPQGALQPHLP